MGSPSSFDLGRPILRAVTLATEAGLKLFFIFGKGEDGGVFAFDGLKAPSLIQNIVATNETLTAVAGIPGGLIAFSKTAAGTFSTKYYAYNLSGSKYAFSAFGTLPTLADNDNMIIPDIHDQIIARQTVKAETEMKPYTNVIPGTQISFAMVPIPGGEFMMGSPDSEPGRKPDEGPQHKVKISPFWMQQCEVTWGEYELFMYPEEERRSRIAEKKSDEKADDLADAVTHPSRPYTEMSFGMGKDGFPAIAMTHHAANKYCQWLSAKTGDFYRLPTEAEWEYACRAGTKTTYFFGNDAKELPKYAWFDENSDFKYQKVMKKKPNPWGLYDMYGNVTEWVLDQYDPDYYKQAAQGVTAPWNKATKPYPHSVRGGSWEDEAPACRSATRRGSERNWKMTDPQLPKSVWYLSDATFVGFRIIRPLKIPTAVEMQKYWSSGTERD
jgi:formylglycine-generating enzyme required for sulfatase activity